MSSLFDSKVSARRNVVPWFCRASVLEWMRMKAADSGEDVELTVFHRHSVASRFWYQLRFIDREGQHRCVTSQHTDILTWRAEVTDETKRPIGAPHPRRGWRVKPLFAWYDLWIGAFVDRRNRRVFIFPVPCIGLVITLPEVRR